MAIKYFFYQRTKLNGNYVGIVTFGVLEVTKHIAINFFKVGRLQLIFNLNLIFRSKLIDSHLIFLDGKGMSMITSIVLEVTRYIAVNKFMWRIVCLTLFLIVVC